MAMGTRDRMYLESHFLIAFALETWLLSHLEMRECFIMDKRARFKTRKKYFSGLRGLPLDYTLKIRLGMRFLSDLEEPSAL